jgi:hypothetical protein
MDGSVTVHMNASADAVWALVSDITRIGEFSPETFEAEWLNGATGPALGAYFRGHVKRNERGPYYWTTCKVIACESGVEFAFAVVYKEYEANTWRYRIAPTADGVAVTESFRMTPNLGTTIYGATLGKLRTKRNLNDMRRTLERMKAVVEKAAV